MTYGMTILNIVMRAKVKGLRTLWDSRCRPCHRPRRPSSNHNGSESLCKNFDNGCSQRNSCSRRQRRGMNQSRDGMISSPNSFNRQKITESSRMMQSIIAYCCDGCYSKFAWLSSSWTSQTWPEMTQTRETAGANAKDLKSLTKSNVLKSKSMMKARGARFQIETNIQSPLLKESKNADTVMIQLTMNGLPSGARTAVEARVALIHQVWQHQSRED